MKKIFLPTLLIILLNISQVHARDYEVEVPSTVDFVDLNRYVGDWLEVASIPQRFQEDCIADVMAQYSLLNDGVVKVENSCLTENGERKKVEGRAAVVDRTSNAKLKVTFVKIFKWIFAFGGDYWIIQLSEDYRYAVVGHASRSYGWILSRAPFLADADLKEIEAKLKKQGYDTCRWLTTKQKGGIPVRMPLCEYVL